MSPSSPPSPHQPPSALSPLDGRYREITEPLGRWLSETGLNQARIDVEVAWMLFLLQRELIPAMEPLTPAQVDYLRSINIFTDEARRTRLAELEAETRHDVKAVEYLIRESLPEAPDGGLDHLAELVHFLCTSEDINNLAYALTVRAAVEQVWLPQAEALRDELLAMARRYADVPMLARTHGQPATPTTMGKEIGVFAARMTRALGRVRGAEYLGKLNGATGTYSAHVSVLPAVDWVQVSREFVESLGLTANLVTTQIEPHDWQVELYSAVTHFNRVAHNLATDCWGYISLGYFRQNLAGQGSTGSSTMPHKVNPIRFENAEANLEMSEGVFEVLSRTLATARFQRDLSDSSMQRNIGVAFGYSLVALDNLRRGLASLQLDRDLLAAELDDHPEVLSEAVQQALRLGSLTNPDDDGPEPYLLLKQLTRGRTVSLEDLREVIAGAGLPEELEQTLLQMTPADYVGLAEDLARLAH